MPVVEMRPAFEATVVEVIAWLGEHRPESWLERFLSALEEVKRDIATFPDAAPAAKQDERIVVIQRRFPDKLPYFVYYAYLRAEPGTIYLTHLFHFSQAHPELDLNDWPW